MEQNSFQNAGERKSVDEQSPWQAAQVKNKFCAIFFFFPQRYVGGDITRPQDPDRAQP
jgi:hypothetical protein